MDHSDRAERLSELEECLEDLMEINTILTAAFAKSKRLDPILEAVSGATLIQQRMLTLMLQAERDGMAESETDAA